MKNFLKKIVSVTKTDIQKLNEALKASLICKPMNDLHESELDNDGTGIKIKIWLNPNNQKCFNYGWFEYQDFYDWLEGKGNIVKGKTNETKKSFGMWQCSNKNMIWHGQLVTIRNTLI